MNPGVEMMMRLARWGARLSRLDRRRQAELRGLNGALNIEFLGPDGGFWHIVFEDGRLDVRPGRHPSPRATVRIRCEDYLAMIAGDLSLSVARLTGKLRVVGEGEFGLIFGAMVGGIQNERKAGGLRGWMARRIVARALRKGGYTPRAQAPGAEKRGEEVR